MVKGSGWKHEVFSIDFLICVLIPLVFAAYLVWNVVSLFTDVTVFQWFFTILFTPTVTAVFTHIVLFFYKTNLFDVGVSTDDR